MVFFGKRSRGEWVKEINQQCVWFVQLNFATYVGVSFSKRKLIYSPINLGFHLLITRIVLYCFLLLTVYHCKCCNKRRFNLQVGKKRFTHKLSIPSRSLFQVMDLGVFARDLYCESRDKTIPQKIPWWNPMLVCKTFFSYPVNWIVVCYITMTGLSNPFSLRLLMLFEFEYPWLSPHFYNNSYGTDQFSVHLHTWLSTGLLFSMQVLW